MNLEELKEELLKDPEFKKEYEKFNLKFWLEETWIEIKLWFVSRFSK